MDFSVIVCTFNRAANLPDCIAHLARQRDAQKITWEVLVVDNNSTDDTYATVERLQREHRIAIRYAFEPRQGLSNARNRGIAQSSSTYAVFIDDDIRVTPLWLNAYAEVFAERDCDAAGGPIRVRSSTPLPAWIRPEMMGFLGELDLGDEPRELDGVETSPFGGNMAFHRRALERVGDFDPDLGRKGSSDAAEGLFKGEETEYFRCLKAGGGAIWYAPKAAVDHHILPYQLERRFFLTIHYNEGYRKVRDAPAVEGRTLFGAPLYIYNQTLRSLGRYLSQTLRRGPSSSMRQLMTTANFFGRIRGHMDKSAAKVGR